MFSHCPKGSKYSPLIIDRLFDKETDQCHCRGVHTSSEDITNLSNCSYWSDHEIITIESSEGESDDNMSDISSGPGLTSSSSLSSYSSDSELSSEDDYGDELFSAAPTYEL